MTYTKPRDESSLLTSAMEPPIDVVCMATLTTACDFKPTQLQRRPLGAHDVLIDMKYCGICHTDLHAATGDVAALMGKHFPCVPGHELAGVCTRVGASVTRFKVGDQVGVGCMVDSCLTCKSCLAGEEQKCTKQVATYNGIDKSGRAAPYGTKHTLGGYTSKMVVHERFGILIPPAYPMECAGVVMCAGVTLFDPLRRYKCAGKRVGIIGVGGLGIMGIKLAKAMGATKVTVVTRKLAKAAAAKAAGADAIVVSTDPSSMAGAKGAVDMLLNTIPSEHDYMFYNSMLAPGGIQIMLGLNTGLVAGIAVDAIVCGASRIKGSGIGGIEATQAVIDLCAAHNILPDIKEIGPEGINAAFEDLDNANPSGCRYVINLAGLKNKEEMAAKCASVPPPRLAKREPLGLGMIVGGILKLLCCCGWRKH